MTDTGIRDAPVISGLKPFAVFISVLSLSLLAMIELDEGFLG